MLHVPVGRPTRERMGIAVQHMLKQVGIQVEVVRMPYNRFQTEVSGKAPFYMDGSLRARRRPSTIHGTTPRVVEHAHVAFQLEALVGFMDELSKARATKDDKERRSSTRSRSTRSRTCRGVDYV